MDSEDHPNNAGERLRRLLDAVEGGDTQQLRLELARSHPAEIADILEALLPEQRSGLWRLLDSEIKGEVLIEAHGEVRQQLIRETEAADLVTAIRRLDMDELADVSAHLPSNVIDAALKAMDVQRRRRFETVRAFPAESAGGLMDADALAVRADVTLRVVLRYLRRVRRQQGGLPEHTDKLMVVDRDNRYLGVIRLSDAVSLEPETLVFEAMDPTVKGIDANLPARKVARLFEDRDLLSAPVVDDTGQLIGRITVDDIVDVIREEGEQSLLSRAGLDRNVDIFAPVLTSARRRAVWLGVNLVHAFVAAWVVGLFREAIEALVALAVLMPVVASMGGVAGNQTLTLVIRGVALQQIGQGNARRILFKELAVGIVNGIGWSLVVGMVAALWFGDRTLAVIFATALIINLLNGAMAGTLIPLLLIRLKIDPALAGGVLLTAATDVIGFASFLGLAAVFLT